MRTKPSQHEEFKLFELLFFYFFPLQLNCRMWEGVEQLKPKLSSSVLYQMAITLQLFFYPSAQQASTTSNKFAKRGRRAWGFWAQIINLDMLKLSERIILSTLCLESSVIKNWETEMIVVQMRETKNSARSQKAWVQIPAPSHLLCTLREFLNLSVLFVKMGPITVPTHKFVVRIKWI